METTKKSGFREWLANFWYYHKWHLLFAGFGLAILILIIVQVTGKEEYDLQILYAGPHIFQTQEKTEVTFAFSQVLERDYNKDGKKNCDFMDMTIMSDEQLRAAVESTDNVQSIVMYNTYSEANVKQNLSQEIAAGEHVICLLDPKWYQMVADQDGFVPLKEILGYQPENAINEYSIYLRDTAFAEYYSAFDVFPEDTILCMRRLSSTIVFTGVKTAETRYENHKSIFKTVMDFKLPDGFSRPHGTESAESIPQTLTPDPVTEPVTRDEETENQSDTI